jgi:hypothetical protein
MRRGRRGDDLADDVIDSRNIESSSSIHGETYAVFKQWA